MSKELEALEEAKELTHRLITSGSWDKIEEQLNIVDSALKALEIIKDKEVNVHFLLVCMDDFSHNDEVGREEYNKQEGSYWHTANALTQEEYDLLKEVLL